MTVYVGTSGWQYRDWRGPFYPQELPQARWLEHFCSRFQTVEVNNTFYRLPERSTFESWAARTPQDFVFSVKMSRFLTHIKRLREAKPVVQRFMSNATGLGERLGPILIQLPPNLESRPEDLSQALDSFDPAVRLVVEFRHKSWLTDETYEILSQRDAAFCLADRGSRPITPIVKTAGWTYLRLHAGNATPHPCYGAASLRGWIGRLGDLWSETEDVYVYFNNDTRACAIRDAYAFANLAASEGWMVSRVAA